ncbi:MAG TPA: leucyl/phenylalanyl-tRNA--protein transferase [Rudaea sp.]|nr:leucyl/phenylalanyl-tRNA--protein transferase [Rudaea sp.]
MIRIPILRAGSAEAFPPVETALAEPDGLLAAGGDLSPARLVEAYRHGIFPWYSEGQPILWWSPDPRTVFATDRVHVATRFARWLRQSPWTFRFDTAFADVMLACAAPRAGQAGTWITAKMFDAFVEMHRLGHAHSLEVYADDELVGGIYGLALGRMFYGESMFSLASNASKAALVALCRHLDAHGYPLLDAQVSSSHLSSLGAFAMPRRRFVAEVARLVALPGRVGPWTESEPGHVRELV